MRFFLLMLWVLYLLSPVDLIPDFIPVIGRLDDLVLLGLLYWNYFRKGGKYTPRAGASSGNRQQSGQNRTYEYQAGYQSRRKPSRDPYRILHIDRSATPEAIRRAYRQQAARYHPDKVAHLGEEFQAMAKEKFQDIQWAYEQLSGKYHA